MVGTLSLHEHKVQQKNKKEGNKRGINTHHVDRLGDRTRWLCLAAAIFALIRYVLDMIEIFEGEIAEEPCKWVRHVKGVFQCATLTCLYLVLWLRQRHFYQLPALHHLSGRVVRFCSYAVIFFMVAANIVTITLYVATRTYMTSSRGCRIKWSIGWNKLPGLLLFIFTTSFQLILLGLLIYPLYRHKSISTVAGNRRQVALFKRLTIATSVAMVTTGVVSILAITALSKNYGALRQVAYGLDMSVTMLSVVCSFQDWRSRLCSCLAEEESVIGSVKRKDHEATTDVITDA